MTVQWESVTDDKRSPKPALISASGSALKSDDKTAGNTDNSQTLNKPLRRSSSCCQLITFITVLKHHLYLIAAMTFHRNRLVGADDDNGCSRPRITFNIIIPRFIIRSAANEWKRKQNHSYINDCIVIKLFVKVSCVKLL